MKKKDQITNIALVLVLVIGLSLLLYPSVSNWWNKRVSSRAVSNYMDYVGVIDNEEYNQMLEDARRYNQSLLNRHNEYTLTDDLRLQYDQLLNVGGMGVIG